MSDSAGSALPEPGNGHGVVATQPERHQSLNYLSTTETSPAARRRSTQSRKASGQSQGLSQVNGAGPSETDEQRERAREPRQEEPWWKRTLRYFKSVELENKGSVARDHLALGGFLLPSVVPDVMAGSREADTESPERTFLAWLRTSLAFASIGIAITQLFRLNTSLAEDTKQTERLRRLGKPLGTTFLAVSILMLLLGYNRYLQGQHWVIKGKFPASRGTILLVSFIAFAVTLASLIIIIAVQSDDPVSGL